MNNIEILEEFIHKVDIYFTDDIGDCAITSKIAGIIEKLIQENKELKDCLQMAKQIMTVDISEDFDFIKLKEFKEYLLNEMKLNENFEE